MKKAWIIVLCTLFERGSFCQTLKPFNENGKWGCKNQSNEIIVPEKCNYADEFPKGLMEKSKNKSRILFIALQRRCADIFKNAGYPVPV